MKVGIVTIVDFNNYGNRLQNYALSTVIDVSVHMSKDLAHSG